MLIENNDSFLSELTRMFNLNREKNNSSLYITMKKYRQKIGVEKEKINSNKSTKKQTTVIKNKKSKVIFDDKDSKCIIRAKIGSKKISTVINSKDLIKFQTAYSSLLRGNIYGLKDKKKVLKKNDNVKTKTN